MSLEELRSHVQEQTERFRGGQPHDDNYCLELFRRAIVDGDDASWRALHDAFQPQVLRWCRRAGIDKQVSAEHLAALAWEKFWRSFKRNKLEQAQNVAAIQRYLKMCARSAAIDWLREQKTWEGRLERSSVGQVSGELISGESLVDGHPSPEEAIMRQVDTQSFWQIVRGYIANDQDRALVQLKYSIGLSSAEIQLRRPDLFPSVDDVYRGSRNFLDRLRRSPVLLAWFNGNNWTEH